MISSLGRFCLQFSFQTLVKQLQEFFTVQLEFLLQIFDALIREDIKESDELRGQLDNLLGTFFGDEVFEAESDCLGELLDDRGAGRVEDEDDEGRKVREQTRQRRASLRR